MVEYAYINAVHTSTRKTPFEVVEGRPKFPPILWMKGNIFTANEYVRDVKESFQNIREAIHASQQWQKRAADKHHRTLEFKDNDWVLLKFS